MVSTSISRSAGLAAAACAFAALAAAPSSALTLSAVQDSDVAEGGGWSTYALGDESHLLANYLDATAVIAYLQFDVSALAPGAVKSATLRLFHDFNATNRASYEVRRVTSAWGEATVTYPTRPSVEPAVYATLAVNDSSTEIWREWDVTTLVQEWVDGGSENYGLALTRDPDVQSWPYFRSRDYEFGVGFPELVISLVPEPNAALLVLAATLFVGPRR